VFHLHQMAVDGGQPAYARVGTTQGIEQALMAESRQGIAPWELQQLGHGGLAFSKMRV
jgi:hypothetical protein